MQIIAWKFPLYPENWAEIKADIKKRDGYMCRKKGCYKPGKKIGGDVDLEVHHIKSLSKGGTNDYSNLVTVCTECHEKLHPHYKKRGFAK